MTYTKTTLMIFLLNVAFACHNKPSSEKSTLVEQITCQSHQ